MVKEKAYAKVNLFLDILSKRPDQYHNLEMVMIPVDFYDTLTFTKTTTGNIELSCNETITEKPEDNIVYQIAEHILQTENIQAGVTIQIDKRIPIAAGLAGGSADAAATLRGLNRLFKLKKSYQELANIGEKFGSDVPYCIYNKLCIARGKGEQLLFLDKKLAYPILIITPPIRVSTKEIYQSVQMEKVPGTKISGINNAIYNQNYDLIVRKLYNALEPFTFKLYPEVQTLKARILEEQVDGVLMSGSGPSIFVLDKNKKRLKVIEEKFRDNNSVILTKIK